MIKYRLNNKTIELESSWEELKQDHFLALMEPLRKVISGEIDVMDFRLCLLEILTGYKRSKKKRSKKEISEINDNLFLMAWRLGFPLKPHYENPEILTVLPAELQEELKTKFPFEILDADHYAMIEGISKLLKWCPVVNLNFKRNLIPKIKIRRKIFIGPRFDIDENGVVDTDICADEFCEASDYLALYEETGDEKYLNNMSAVFYRENRAEFDATKVRDRAKLFAKHLNDDYRSAIVLFFKNIYHYVQNHSVYSALYQASGEKKSEFLNIGLAKAIFQVSEEGLGSYSDVKRWLLPDFLNQLIRQIEKGVSTYRNAEKTDFEIAEILGLPLEIIEKM
ncbi:MAG: hypothetical protein N4A59_16390 [Marinifilum sp.]|jgi:hypothetical protein|nr:hypothetical protein [Marinifilum sp.]